MSLTCAASVRCCIRACWSVRDEWGRKGGRPVCQDRVQPIHRVRLVHKVLVDLVLVYK